MGVFFTLFGVFGNYTVVLVILCIPFRLLWSNDSFMNESVLKRKVVHCSFYDPGLKGLPWTSSNPIARPFVCLSGDDTVTKIGL